MRIAITGASGSLGRALLRRLTTSGAERIVAFSRDEQKRAALEADFRWHPGVRVYAGDVRDADRLPDLFRDCEVVVHAAARKVVTAHTDEPREMFQTNIAGTLNVVNAARKAGVRKLLFISSDKAVRPENAYGVSKAMAEAIVVGENGRTFPQGLRMGVLRYGNVVGSTGSVVTIWRRLLAEGKAIPVSHVDMTRFWVTLPQAVGYVMKALDDMRGGEIFVPDIPAAPIVVLAQACGALANAWIPMGIRPGGEKLHEELLSASEIRRARCRNGFFVVPPYQGEGMWDNTPWLGEPLADGFEYRSDTWQRQLDVEGMKALLEENA